MMKSLLATGLGILAFVSGVCQAQTIDTRHSTTFALPATQSGATTPRLAKLQQPVVSPIMTRAIASRDSDGKLTVKCQVEDAPLAKVPQFPVQNVPHRK